MSLFSSLFGNNPKTRRSTGRHSSIRLMLEDLEGRTVPAVSVIIPAGPLNNFVATVFDVPVSQAQAPYSPTDFSTTVENLPGISAKVINDPNAQPMPSDGNYELVLNGQYTGTATTIPNADVDITGPFNSYGKDVTELYVSEATIQPGDAFYSNSQPTLIASNTSPSATPSTSGDPATGDTFTSSGPAPQYVPPVDQGPMATPVVPTNPAPAAPVVGGGNNSPLQTGVQQNAAGSTPGPQTTDTFNVNNGATPANSPQADAPTLVANNDDTPSWRPAKRFEPSTGPYFVPKFAKPATQIKVPQPPHLTGNVTVSHDGGPGAPVAPTQPAAAPIQPVVPTKPAAPVQPTAPIQPATAPIQPPAPIPPAAPSPHLTGGTDYKSAKDDPNYIPKRGHIDNYGPATPPLVGNANSGPGTRTSMAPPHSGTFTFKFQTTSNNNGPNGTTNTAKGPDDAYVEKVLDQTIPDWGSEGPPATATVKINFTVQPNGSWTYHVVAKSSTSAAWTSAVMQALNQ